MPQSFDQLVAQQGPLPIAGKGKNPPELPKRNVWPWLLGGAVGLGGLWWFASSASAATSSGPTEAELQAEAEACEWVAKNRPVEHQGRTAASVGATNELDWLTWVAFLRSHPSDPAAGGSVGQGASHPAFQRLRPCVDGKLKQVEVGPLPGKLVDPPGAKDPQDFLAEEAACLDVVAQKPAGHLNRVRPLGMTDRDWWSLIGYWKAYPDGPPQPKGTAYAAAAERIAACVKGKLAEEGGPVDIDVPAAPVPNDQNITAAPTPERFYRIKGGDNFTGVTAAAYGTSGAATASAMQKVNQHPYNRRFWVVVESEKHLFPEGRISFTPIFGTLAQQIADMKDGGRGQPASNSWAVFYFPPKAEVL